MKTITTHKNGKVLYLPDEKLYVVEYDGMWVLQTPSLGDALGFLNQANSKPKPKPKQDK